LLLGRQLFIEAYAVYPRGLTPKFHASMSSPSREDVRNETIAYMRSQRTTN